MQLNGKMRRMGQLPNRQPRPAPAHKSSGIVLPNVTTSWPSQKEFVTSALDQYEQGLTSYATRMFHGDEEAAKDAVQHTFMQLCKQSPEKVGPRLVRWLYTVCRNRVLDDLKSHKRRTKSTPDNFEAVDLNAVDPADHFERQDFLDGIKRLFACLRSGERDVIELWSHGLDTGEIAEVLNKKAGTVRVNLHRAIKRLKQHPDIKTWLERATGQVDCPDAKPTASAANQNSTPTITGERK